MITQTDSLSSVEFEDYYVILPSTPSWDIEKFIHESNTLKGKRCEFGFSYNSGENDSFLTVAQLRELIENHL